VTISKIQTIRNIQTLPWAPLCVDTPLMTPTTIYCTYRRTSFFRRRRFLRFWRI